MRPEQPRVPNRRNPRPARRWRGSPYEVRVLDPANSPQVNGRPTAEPTAYVGARVIIPKAAVDSGVQELLRGAAEELGWAAHLEREDPRTRKLTYGARIFTISVAEGKAVRPP